MDPVIYLFLLLLELFMLSIITAYSVGLLFSSIMGAPYVPTQKKRLADILKKASMKKDDLFIELGSGDGRLIRMAASKYQIKGIGIEINPLLVYLARLLTYRDRLKNVTYIKQNILQSDLSKANFIYLFLMPSLIEKVKPVFEKQLKKGTVVISHGFKISGWEKRMYDQIKTEPFSTFYYRV